MEKQIFIKGMVCNRCITVLQTELERRGISVQEVSLGRVTLACLPNERVMGQLQEVLLELGLELLVDRQTRLLSQIKEIVQAELVKLEDRQTLSSLLADRLHLNYSSLNEAFSQHEGVTIEQYYIQKRLERVKELLHTDRTFTEIAFRTGFSSVHHFSKHFKDQTGLTPTHFRQELRVASLA